MRKSASTACILISFVAMAGFGFLAMNLQGDMQGCIAALTRGGECPANSDSAASLAFHAGALKGFSTATVGTGFLLVLAAFFVLAVALSQRGSCDTAVPFLAAYSRYKQEVRALASPLAQRIQRWFSLHENIPAVA